MKKFNINDFNRGWFVGNFEPSLIKTNDVEVAYKSFEVGETEKKHFHKIATELTLVANGRISMNNIEYVKGDIVVIEPNTPCDFKAIEKSNLVVVKYPGASNDKYEVDE